MLINQGVKPEEGDLALSAVPCKEDNPEECALRCSPAVCACGHSLCCTSLHQHLHPGMAGAGAARAPGGSVHAVQPQCCSLVVTAA